MTKEECLKALEKIKNDQYFIAEDDEGDLIHIVNLYKNELKTLRCLIEEHFNNPLSIKGVIHNIMKLFVLNVEEVEYYSLKAHI